MWSASAPSEPQHGSPEDAGPPRARVPSRALPPSGISRREKSEVIAPTQTLPVNNEAVQRCCLRAPAAAAHEGRGPAASLLPAQDCSQLRRAGSTCQRPPMPLCPGAVLASPHLWVPPGMPARSLSPPPRTSPPAVTRGEPGLGGGGPGPMKHEWNRSPNADRCLRGKTWQAGCVSSGVRNPAKQQVASGVPARC